MKAQRQININIYQTRHIVYFAFNHIKTYIAYICTKQMPKALIPTHVRLDIGNLDLKFTLEIDH